MDSQLRFLYQERSSQVDTLGILHVQKKEALSPITDGFDDIILVVTQNIQETWYVNHFHYEDKRLQVVTVNQEELNEWLAAGSNRRAVEWIVYGKILFERNEHISSLKERLISFPYEMRTKKMCIEFGRLIRRYQEGKELLKSGDYLDSFNQILHALHHWARLSIIENGYHPELTLWRQVKKIAPEIYKLYDELLMGQDSLEKRIELLLLASEFSLASKTSLGAAHLIQVMKKKEEPWLIEDLLKEAEVKEYALDLGILLEHLVKKHIVKEVFDKNICENIHTRAYQLVTD